MLEEASAASNAVARGPVAVIGVSAPRCSKPPLDGTGLEPRRWLQQVIGMETLVSDVGPGFVLQDRSCRIWHQDVVGRPYHPAANWILESCCSPSSSVQSIRQLATKCFKIWKILGSRAWLAHSILKRCVARLGTLVPYCTETVLGQTYVLRLVLGRRYDGCFHCYAGRRSSCPHRQRVRGLGDWART